MRGMKRIFDIESVLMLGMIEKPMERLPYAKEELVVMMASISHGGGLGAA
jgi:hypothetical protein